MKRIILFFISTFPIFTLFGQDGDFDADYHKVWFAYKTFPELSCTIVKKTYSNELPKPKYDSSYFTKKKEKLYFRNYISGWEYFLDEKAIILYNEKEKQYQYKKLKGNEYQKYFRFFIGSEIEFKIKNKDSVVYGGTADRLMKYTITNYKKPISNIIIVTDTLADVFKELHYIYFREKAYTLYTYTYVKNTDSRIDEKVTSEYYYTYTDKTILPSERFQSYSIWELGKKKKKKKKLPTK